MRKFVWEDLPGDFVWGGKFGWDETKGRIDPALSVSPDGR